jgi:hypothetical protein
MHTSWVWPELGLQQILGLTHGYESLTIDLCVSKGETEAGHTEENGQLAQQNYGGKRVNHCRTTLNRKTRACPTLTGVRSTVVTQ